MFNLIGLFLISNLALAQEVGVKVNGSNSAEDTTISIKKGAATAKKKYVISEGQDDISGEKDVLKKTAERNWKKVCDDWKAELKENNKNHNLISSTCGVMTCIKEGVESSCTSKGSYKIRTLSEE